MNEFQAISTSHRHNADARNLSSYQITVLSRPPVIESVSKR